MLQLVTPLTLQLNQFILKQQIFLKCNRLDVIFNQVTLLQQCSSFPDVFLPHVFVFNGCSKLFFPLSVSKSATVRVFVEYQAWIWKFPVQENYFLFDWNEGIRRFMAVWGHGRKHLRTGPRLVWLLGASHSDACVISTPTHNDILTHKSSHTHSHTHTHRTKIWAQREMNKVALFNIGVYFIYI